MFRYIRRELFPTAIRALFWFIPTRYWYRCACLLRNALSPLYDACRAEAHYWAYNKRLKQGWLLNRLLEILTETGYEFPIAYTLEGESALHGLKGEQGVCVCTAHLPFVNVIARAFCELGLQVPHAIAANCPPSRAFVVFGKANVTSPCIKADKYCLVKARRALANGSVIVMIDSDLHAYSANMLRVASKVGVRTVFAFSELGDDGKILIYFKAAPYAVCHTESEIEINLLSFAAEFARFRRSEVQTSAPGTSTKTELPGALTR